MKFAFAMPHLMELAALTKPWEMAQDGRDLTRMARCADELGYDMIFIPEHLILPHEHLELSGPHWLHATVAQAHFAGATERIRLGSSITILPLRHPVDTAKALATADWLSDGRMTVSFGVGWLKDEFEMLGVPFAERGRMSDEYLEAIIALWTQDAPSFHGKYVSFDKVVFAPKPVQKPHLPIWIGGDADAPLRRAARFASGWFPFLTPPKEIPARLDFIKSQPTYDGRPFEVTYGLGSSVVGEGHKLTDDPTTRPGMSAEQIIDKLGWYAELGITQTSLPIPRVRGADEYLDYARWVIEEIKPKVP
jgi:probable F420-dependent oxidoreductase